MRRLPIRPATAALGPLAALAAVGTQACVTTPRAVAPSPISVACASLTPPAFVARGTLLLRENGWTLREADSTRGVLRATRGPVYAGLGENITVDGPYFITTVHDGREARVTVQLIETHNHRVIPVENLNDRSNYSDARNFLPVLDGLREACGVPTSGRLPARTPPPQLPPGGGGQGRR